MGNLIAMMSPALTPIVIFGIFFFALLFFTSKQKTPSPATRTTSMWILGAMLVFTCMMLFMTQVGPMRWLDALGLAVPKGIFVLIAIIVLAVGSLVTLLMNPKTRPWGVGLLTFGAVGILPLLLMFYLLMPMRVARQEIFEQYRQHPGPPISLAKIEWPREMPEIPRNIAKIELPESARYSKEKATPTEKNQTESQPSGSGHSKDTSEKETAKPLPNGRGSEKSKSRAPVESYSYYMSPDERPGWVDDPPRKIGNAYCRVLTVGPYTTRLECDKKMPRALRQAVKEYIDLYLEDNPKYHWPVELSDGYIRTIIVKDTWEETKETSVGQMIQVHVLLGFNSETNRRIEKQVNDFWYKRRVADRITGAIVAVGTLLVVMLIVFLVLKFNLAPKLVPYRWHALQALVVCVLIMMAITTLFMCLYVDDNLQKYSLGNIDHTGPDRISHDLAQRDYVRLATGLWLVLPIMGATMIFLGIRKKTRILGITGGVVVLIVILGSFLILGF